MVLFKQLHGHQFISFIAYTNGTNLSVFFFFFFFLLESVYVFWQNN